MDRNQAIGLVLIFGLILVYIQFFAPTPEPPANADGADSLATATQGSSAVAQAPVLAPKTMPQDTISGTDSAALAQKEAQYGVFAMAMQGPERAITLQNKHVAFNLSTYGAYLRQVQLKEYQTWDGQPLLLVTPQSSQFSLLVDTPQGKVDLYNLVYTAADQNGQPVSSLEVNGTDTLTLVLSAPLTNGTTIEHRYTLAPEGYQLQYELRAPGLDQALVGNTATLRWQNQLRALERRIDESRNNSTLRYYTAAGEGDRLEERLTEPEELSVAEPVKWVSVKQKFFTSGIIAEQPFKTAGLAQSPVPEADTTTVRSANLELNLANNQLNGLQLTYYFGPNDYNRLRKVTDGFGKNMYLGWFPVSLVNKYLIIPVFHFLEKFIGNYGVIIIILVLLIKLLLLPLSYRSYISMAKTKVLKPEIDEIKERVDGDMQKQQQETMKLYQQVGVNPLSGCIPLVLQMPVLFAMFYFFPQSIELRQEAFLWAPDLSTYDAFINLPFTIPAYGNHVSLFTLLMTASTILYTWSNNQISSVQGPMKNIGYIMPVVFMFVLNSFPAGLSFYYFVSNLVTFGQQAVIRRFVNEDKIRKVLEENKKRNKNKKGGGFQARLQEAMKNAEAQKKERDAAKEARAKSKAAGRKNTTSNGRNPRRK